MKKNLIIVFVLILFLGYGCDEGTKEEPKPEYKPTAVSYVKNAKTGTNTAYIPFEGFERKQLTGNSGSEGQALVIEILDEFQKTHQAQIISYNILIDGGGDPIRVIGICITFFKPEEKQGGGTINEEK